MAGMNWDEMTAEERLMAEQVVLNLRSLNRVARLAPDGLVLDGEVPRSPAHQAVIDELRNDLSPHAHHLHYAERLKEGRSIGSGQIESACKNL